MNIYYIDYENVSSQGLKGVELLSENDEVVLLYSKKADNVKIDILTMMMESKARIRFLPVHVGTPNALDFQLVTLLFLNYRPDDFCYIISKDSGYDCCIKTAAENGAPNVARYPNIESAVNKAPAKKTRRGKRTSQEAASQQIQSQPQAQSRSQNQAQTPSQDQLQSEAQPHLEENASDSSEHAPEEGARKKSSRRRGKKKPQTAESEAAQPGQSADGSEDAANAEPKKASVSSEPKQDAANALPKKAPANEMAVPKEADKPQEVVLRQRYLLKQFEPKIQPGFSAAARTDAEKPVSILSVIRRRNDVQLDMHQVDLIREALKSAGNKQQFYSYFVKKLGQKQGIELYHSIKSSYTDLVNANLI